MKININISPNFKIPFISINSSKRTEEIEKLSNSISNFLDNQNIIGSKNGNNFSIPLYQIIRFHTLDKKVVFETSDQDYFVNKRIYQLNEILSPKDFMQISSSEIIAISAIKRFSLSKTGYSEIILTNNKKTYTSRRYMNKLKETLLK